ncbi:hypothetical protein NEOLEDRAFT_1093966 [Neolentinus lepideus HHB14362 ss-1]|uniref:Uncharacterized protein n=1 Tax=Neolentinus lepideus HHB14362 ss-1 TaxID=1314782 RepID=A0A165S507_9AGAM|nr:hypothetical protein NEOLEDRAFT_1093966 [Neolentinus lepideus HHB14362 ss-1]
MAATRQHPPRLHIPPSINNAQPPQGFEGTPMFSPALPSGLPQFPMNPHAVLQTPLQASFLPPHGLHGRPPHMGHGSRPSLAHLALAGMPIPSGVPMTPLGQNQFPPPMLLNGAPFGPPLTTRNRRAPSISIGGPPKAPLGGPGRNHSPLPVPLATSAASNGNVAPTQKARKCVVNLPKETVKDEENADTITRPSWARTPMHLSYLPAESDIRPPETISVEAYPSDAWRYELPDSVDVFLPGKGAWNAIKQKVIEEKLERLGVERGSGSNVPHIHAPHARAASISSPADPALLFFKLNKLQQSQNASASNSLSTSPQPGSSLSASPNPQIPPRFQNRHGHSMSLAQPSTAQASSVFYNPASGFNPFGPTATLGSDSISPRPLSVGDARSDMIAPQARVPVTISSLAPPLSSTRPESRPDFIRGFGLDIPEEREEDLEAEEAPTEDGANADESTVTENEGDVIIDAAIDEVDLAMEQDVVTAGPSSRVHSRHVSRLSATLSLRSVGGHLDLPVDGLPRSLNAADPLVSELDHEAVQEWTGSEDLRTGAEKSDDEESLGEFSNPSDEERARLQRLHRRTMRRGKGDMETPRRLPNFPRPPEMAPAYMSIPPDMGKDDEIMSNPSDEGHASEGHAHLGIDSSEYYRPSSHDSSIGGRPLPPLPHSRQPSAQFSYHDPALAHSRHPSEQLTYSNLSQPALPRRESLNPLAKPFVFGAPAASAFVPPALDTAPLPPTLEPSQATHSRVPSFGKPLNAAAQEFKPTFSFVPPPAAAQFTFTAPLPESSRPLPVPPTQPTPVRAQQGREKRQRLSPTEDVEMVINADTDADDAAVDMEDETGRYSFKSFKFPPVSESPQVVRRSAPTTPPGSNKYEDLGAGTKPFTFGGFSTFPSVPTDAGSSPGARETELPADITTLAQQGSPSPIVRDLPIPPTFKPKRAPIPLDFKHPVSTNTVPAGLFKALVNGNGEERTRRAVRSRLSSREIFDHVPRSSLDDTNVPSISRKISRSRLATDPLRRDSMASSTESIAMRPRRSSLPALHSAAGSSFSGISIPPIANLSKRDDLDQYERRLEVLLDAKIEELRQDLYDIRQSGDATINPSTEAMINEVVTLFRTQLQESAVRDLENSQADARGELDFQLIREVIERGQAEAQVVIRQELAELGQRVEMQTLGSQHGLGPAIEEYSARTINAIVSSVSQLAGRVESLASAAGSASAGLPPSLDRESLVRDIVTVLSPQLASLRSEPIDYEGLTTQLSQAVKPHIAQLIDLASDKRETAGLIVDRLLPLLPNLETPPTLDEEAIVTRLTTEMRRVVAPLDAHEIKEHVSDLVVERLDSRLAVRDKAFNMDVLTTKVSESVSSLLQPLMDTVTTAEVLKDSQQALSAQSEKLANIQENIMASLSALPTQVLAATERLQTVQADLEGRDKQFMEALKATVGAPHLASSINELLNSQRTIVGLNDEIATFRREVMSSLEALPDMLTASTKVLQDAYSDLISRAGSRQDQDELRRLTATNTELQVQLAKARGAHGQVRVEKDTLNERLIAVEAERDRLRVQIEDLETTATAKTTEADALESKTSELEEALSRALARLKSSDVASQTHQERIAELERTSRELRTDKEALKTKVDSLDSQARIAIHDKEAAERALDILQKEHDRILSQQVELDDLRRTTEQLEQVIALIQKSDNEEIRELRRIRDRSKTIEGEYAALQKRVKEQETKVASSERAATAAKQTLTTTQQRAAEWEKRAKEYEADLELTRTRLDYEEQKGVQLDADYSLAKLQLEEKDADARLSKDRESKLRDQVSSLEAQVARLQGELEKTASAPAPLTVQNVQNGTARSVSRASTVYGPSRSSTPVAVNGKAGSRTGVISPPQTGVWESMHAPRPYRNAVPVTPKGRQSQYYRPQIASPTPSTVSLAPTLGEDGWWS